MYAISSYSHDSMKRTISFRDSYKGHVHCGCYYLLFCDYKYLVTISTPKMFYHISSKVYANLYNRQLHTVFFVATYKKSVLELLVETTFQEMLIMSVTRVINCGTTSRITRSSSEI